MEFIYTDPFKEDYQKLPQHIKKRTQKQLRFLLQNLRHPSLRAKKMKGYEDIWEAAVTKNYRFTFAIEGNYYILRRIGTHDLLHSLASSRLPARCELFADEGNPLSHGQTLLLQIGDGGQYKGHHVRLSLLANLLSGVNSASFAALRGCHIDTGAFLPTADLQEMLLKTPPSKSGSLEKSFGLDNSDFFRHNGQCIGQILINLANVVAKCS
ncbi:MAG: type II toxin-antitoxin system YafQ family toxin [Candidatus Bipolaricaulia bacterium]